MTAGYVPPPYMIASVLHGTFNFADMHPEYIRPIVWVVAHRPPKNNSERSVLVPLTLSTWLIDLYPVLD